MLGGIPAGVSGRFKRSVDSLLGGHGDAPGGRGEVATQPKSSGPFESPPDALAIVGKVSHDLRSPLNAILGFTGTLLMGLSGPVTEKQTRDLETMEASGRHLLSMIDELIELARLELGDVELTVEPVGCRALLEEVVASLRPLAGAKQLALELEAPANEIELWTDSSALRRILFNLGDNAIRFTSSGRVVVRLSRPVRDGRRLTRFDVVDTGIGIAPGEQDEVFKAFRGLESSAKRGHEGMGIGLYSSRKLAHLLDGRISVESRLGEGSHFALELEEHHATAGPAAP